MRHDDGRHYGWRIDCPACEDPHVLSGWTFNGDEERPTFSPSLLVKYNGPDADTNGAPAAVCHSFIVDGRIQYLGDCTHKFAGQTVDLPECRPYAHEISQ